ncbi:MAG: hypothetical protein ACLUB2_07180 [Butyricicoccus pullicaecorum]
MSGTLLTVLGAVSLGCCATVSRAGCPLLTVLLARRVAVGHCHRPARL